MVVYIDEEYRLDFWWTQWNLSNCPKWLIDGMGTIIHNGHRHDHPSNIGIYRTSYIGHLRKVYCIEEGWSNMLHYLLAMGLRNSYLITLYMLVFNSGQNIRSSEMSDLSNLLWSFVKDDDNILKTWVNLLLYLRAVSGRRALPINYKAPRQG